MEHLVVTLIGVRGGRAFWAPVVQPVDLDVLSDGADGLQLGPDRFLAFQLLQHLLGERSHVEQSDFVVHPFHGIGSLVIALEEVLRNALTSSLRLLDVTVQLENDPFRDTFNSFLERHGTGQNRLSLDFCFLGHLSSPTLLLEPWSYSTPTLTQSKVVYYSGNYVLTSSNI